MFLFFLILGITFNTENFSIVALLQSVFFLANSDTAINCGAFTFVFWSIAVELHFYLLFPLLLVCVQKWGWKVLLVLILALLVVRAGAYFAGADMRVLSYWTIVGRLDQFVLGMLTGIYYRAYFVAGKRLDYVAIGGQAWY